MDRTCRIFILFLLFSSNAFSSQKTITISMLSELNIFDKVQQHFLTSYSRMGYRVKFVEMPPGRATLMANKGDIDGVSLRVTSIENSAPNLVRVPVLLIEGALMLYCVEDVVCDESVVNRDKTMIGAVAHAAVMSEYMEDKKASPYLVHNTEQLGALLSKKRLDYILSIEIDGVGNFQNLSDSYQNVELERLNVYHYLHKKHEKLIPEVAQHFQQTIDELGALYSTH